VKTTFLMIAALAVLFSPLGASAQQSNANVKTAPPAATPRTADNHPDLTGFWKSGTGDKFSFWHIGKDLPGRKLPFTQAGEAAAKHNQTETVDPESLCIIGGTPRHNVTLMGFEVLQGARKIAFLYNDGAYRLIPIDPKRKHPADPDPSFFGDELGHWEGDTLVIDSVAFKDEHVWIDEYANPLSDALHVVERWTRPDAGHIHVETLIGDPKFYTKSFTYSRTWLVGDPDDQVQEFSCSENNHPSHLGLGPGPILKDGTIGYEDPAPLPPPSKIEK
jgi:hypothetical protein